MTSSIPIAVADPLMMAWFECNDAGNARRVEVLAGGLLKWVDDEFWSAFDGQRWSQREGEYRARALALDVARHINDEAAALADLVGDPEKPDAAALREQYGEWCTPQRALERLKLLRGHAVRSGNASQTSAMLTQAKVLPALRAWSEDFDVDPLAYNVLNGTLRFLPPADDGGPWRADFREGHDPADMISQVANVAYDPNAECPMWLERLSLVQPDAEQCAIFARMYGQTLTGLTDCEEFYVHKGLGGDGKSKTHEIIADLHGDYYRHSPVKTFLQASFQKSGSEHRSDLVRLAGDIRMVVSEEPAPNVAWDGELLKMVTGGGHVTARGSGAKTEITYKPRWKLFVEVNPLPRIPGDDRGFRRRLKLVLWPVDLRTVEGGFEAPERLRKRLMTEKAGILNWMIAGCLDWLADRRIPVPQVMAEALENFWAESSPLAEWLEERCDQSDKEAETGATVLWKDFKAWLEKNEISTDNWNTTKFGKQLTQRQIQGKKDGRGYKVRKGIKLRDDVPLLGEEADDAPRGARPPVRDDDRGAGGGFGDGDDGLGDWR
ncbi:DNA primase family protein [Croceicoccus naphthovorans]|uniref:DNA primase family protein n=1 Tax=Croceicoccus naphthovorans TaxID=1348774 RepID=UPI0009E399EE|nr:DNA primase family protein [Croceicoccus naphthovorans]MBB3991321.1 putative DNA primase/helicase [Croceicoccus naphthovorans]